MAVNISLYVFVCKELSETLKQLQRLQKRINELRMEINEQKNVEDPAPVCGDYFLL